MTENVRLALKRRLEADWQPATVEGWDPTLDWGDGNRLYAHLGEYDDSMPNPQLTLESVSETPTTDTGYYATAGDGSGHVAEYVGRIDANVWTDEDVAGEPQLIAEDLAREVRDIVHANARWLVDPESGERVVEELSASGPALEPDPGGTPTDWQALVEIQYRRTEDPPDR